MCPMLTVDYTRFCKIWRLWKQSRSCSVYVQIDLNRVYRSSTTVSLKAREVLILGQMPSYEERLVQMEAVLKNSVSTKYYGEQAQAPRYEYIKLSFVALSTPT